MKKSILLPILALVLALCGTADAAVKNISTIMKETRLVPFMKAAKMDSSKEARAALAESLGITEYDFSARKNTELLVAIKEIKVQESAAKETRLVPFMEVMKMNSSKAARKALAAKHGIEGYDFSARKNTELLKALKTNEEVVAALPPAIIMDVVAPPAPVVPFAVSGKMQTTEEIVAENLKKEPLLTSSPAIEAVLAPPADFTMPEAAPTATALVPATPAPVESTLPEEPVSSPPAPATITQSKVPEAAPEATSPVPASLALKKAFSWKNTISGLILATIATVAYLLLSGKKSSGKKQQRPTPPEVRTAEPLRPVISLAPSSDEELQVEEQRLRRRTMDRALARKENVERLASIAPLTTEDLTYLEGRLPNCPHADMIKEMIDVHGPMAQ